MKVGDVITLVAAAGAVAATVLGAPTWAVWTTKVLVILLMLLLAAAGTSGRYRTFVLLGLLASAVGDLIFLMQRVYHHRHHHLPSRGGWLVVLAS